jgi:hypothetical protein
VTHRQGLLEVDLARLLAAMLGDLGVSTLRFIKTMTQFSSLLSIKLAMLPTSMLGDYSTSASSTPSCFPHHTDLLGNPFLITSLLDLLFLLFFFFGSLYQPSCPPWYSNTTISMHLRCHLNFVIIISIYWKPASYRSSLDLSSSSKNFKQVGC